MRFVTRFDWDDDDGSDSGFSLRGTVHLPRISERLSLVFEGDDGDAEEDFDLTLKLSSRPNLKPGMDTH